jgi:ABC-type phosphate/phosphonate transport system substrate-binding protein
VDRRQELGETLIVNAILAATFLFLKTGEKFATQETAGPTVGLLTTYVGDKVGAKLEPHVMNDPVKAAEFCAADKPPVGIVTPGFYLQYAKALGMEPLLETQRTGVKHERYVVVARKEATDNLAKWEGKTIATPLASEQRYVTSVVLQGKLGEEIRLRQVNDVEGAVFDLAEGKKDAPDAVLMESAAWKLFEKDEELGPKLKAVFTSDELPGNLVVLLGSKSDPLDADKLKAALKGMNGSEDGQKILQNIRVEAFVDIDKERLSKAQTRFYGK